MCTYCKSYSLYCQRLIVPLAIAIALIFFARAIVIAGVFSCAALWISRASGASISLGVAKPFDRILCHLAHHGGFQRDSQRRGPRGFP